MIYNIQTLRAIAALNVVLFHIIGVSRVDRIDTPYLHYLSGWGQCGVDIFFVISGFVMLQTQLHRPKGPGQFLANRIARIVPLYWLLTILMVAICVMLPSAFKSISVDPFSILASLLLVSGLQDKMPIIYVGWTLELEMLFYLVFAIGIALRNRVAAGLFCALALIGITAAGNALPIEFLFGMVCAWIFARYPNLPIGPGALIVGTLLLIGTLIDPGYVNAPGNWRVLFWGVPSALILLGAIYSRQIENKAALYLGAASYSIYLAQVFSIAAFYKFVAPHLLIPGDGVAIIGFVASGVFGCMVYELGEKPANHIWRRITRSRALAVPNSDPALNTP